MPYGSSYGIPYGLKPVFKIICKESNPIFQVANYKSKIYTAKNWEPIYDTDTLYFNKMQQEAKEAGNNELAKKYEMYENIHKGHLTCKFGKYEIASLYFESALKLGNNDYAVSKLNECKTQLKIINEKYENFVNVADSSFNNYKFIEANSFYHKALKVKVHDKHCQNRIYLISDMKKKGEKYYKIGSEFYQKNELDSAIHYYKVVDYFYPNDTGVLNSLGRTYLVNKQFDEALITFEKAKSVTKTTDKTYMYIIGNLAHSYLLTGNTEKATEIYYANKKKQVGDKLWENVVVSDFNTFIDLGIKNEFYYEIAKKLKRKNELKQMD